jgi:hypothetical protein
VAIGAIATLFAALVAFVAYVRPTTPPPSRVVGIPSPDPAPATPVPTATPGQPTSSTSTTPIPASGGPATSATSKAKDFLADLKPVAWDWGFGGLESGEWSINGATYLHSISFGWNGECTGNGGGSWQYDLGRTRTSFEASIGLTDYSPTDGVGHFEVFVDDGLKYSHAVSFGHSIQVAVNVAGGLRLKLVVTVDRTRTCQEIRAVWGDASIS